MAKTRYPCLKCRKKYCTALNTLCNKCELQTRIDSIDVMQWRQRIIEHYDKHHPKRAGELAKPKYKLFILKKAVGKCGGERWLLANDISLGYPRWDKELKKVRGKYQQVDVISVHTYAWRSFDIGGDGPGLYKYYEFGDDRGRFRTGTCIIPSEPVIWLEGSYANAMAKAYAEKADAKSS